MQEALAVIVRAEKKLVLSTVAVTLLPHKITTEKEKNNHNLLHCFVRVSLASRYLVAMLLLVPIYLHLCDTCVHFTGSPRPRGNYKCQ